MEVSSVLGVAVLSQKSCVALEIWALVDIELQGRSVRKGGGWTGLDYLFFG